MARKQSIKSDFRFVDVRPISEYDRYHIPDSINIPLYLVKTKEFLKNVSIVLVNEGRSTAELETACGELKQAGFEKVAVLEGGLFAWGSAKGELRGSSVELSKLNRMTPAELVAEHTYTDWAAIDMSTPGKSKELRLWLPANLSSIPLNAKGNPVSRIVSRISALRKVHPQQKIVLVADDNSAYEKVEAGLTKAGVSGVLLLDGGMKDYREYVSRQVALWKEQNQPKRYAACRG